MTDPGHPKSLKDFNYFDEHQHPPRTSEESSELPLTPAVEERLQQYRKRGRRLTIELALAVTAVLAVGWFSWGYRYSIAYALSSQSAPLRLGDVTTMTPADIPHNAWVAIEGITEHRGLVQTEVRGLSLGREEYWYFRLLGSRGVFIAALNDNERFGIASEVAVNGRAVDPARDHCCDKVLDSYRERFHPREAGPLRIIQVDLRPGEGFWPYLLLLLVQAVVVASAAWTVTKVRRHARARRFASLPVGLPER
ncbi:MAG: hypothetical protein HY903_12130 [Deltaproteobacteria bacterium]|nr:hypothetical protein [Deltaproteobacteria bacterium]